AWRHAARVGEGDLQLGEDLAEVQRERLTIAADDALSGMFTLVAVAPAVALEAQVSAPAGAPAVAPAPSAVAPAATGATGATLADVCMVAGLAEPVPGEPISDDQVAAVLRWLRFSTNPPMSGRAAIAAFRAAGYIATEARLWDAWRAISGTTNP
ncbi:hypothetical protein AB0E96_40925, partial [Kitasatospora sp. NPDC036755]